MNEDDLKRIRVTMDRMSQDALRVLAVAYRDIAEDFDHSHPEQAEEDLVFLGLVGMHDPARPRLGSHGRVSHRRHPFHHGDR